MGAPAKARRALIAPVIPLSNEHRPILSVVASQFQSWLPTIFRGSEHHVETPARIILHDLPSVLAGSAVVQESELFTCNLAFFAHEADLVAPNTRSTEGHGTTTSDWWLGGS